MKKFFSVSLILCLCLTLLAACGTTAAPETPAAGNTSPEEVPTLVVANWKGYGADEPFGAARFEELYNCKVEFVYFNSLEELNTMLLTGGVGNIIGTLFGVLSLSTIKNIVSSLGLDEAWWTNITVAAMICLFLVIQSLVLSRKNKGE